MRKALGIAALLLAVAMPARAAVDTLTIGTAEQKPGGGSENEAASVAVPVFIRDSSGTALDTGTVAQIQGVQFTITFDPAKISGCATGNLPNCRVSFQPSGVFTGHNPVISVLAKTAHSVIVRYEFSRATDSLSFDLDASLPGNLIGYLLIFLPQSLTAGTTVGLTVDRTADMTFLYDGADEAVTESEGNGLTMVNGEIAILDEARSCDPVTISDLSLTFMGDQGCSPSVACKVGETITFSLDRTGGLAGCETVRWAFGDGKVDVGVMAQHTYATTGTRVLSATVSSPSNEGFIILTQAVDVEGVPATCVPVCTATVPEVAQKEVAVDFTGTSSCPGSRYVWNFGDGKSVVVTGQGGTSVVPHAYETAGAFPWTLTVIADGQECHKSGTIIVSEPPAKRRRAVRS